jgi:hypothetical protein
MDYLITSRQREDKAQNQWPRTGLSFGLFL